MQHIKLRIPFDLGTYEEPFMEFPRKVPFILEYDDKELLIREKITRNIRTYLKKYYEKGGYGSTPLGQGDYGKRQGDELFDVISGMLTEESKNIHDMNFLEIGSSYGYLLYLLKQHGARDVLGVEPGDEGVIGGKKYGVPFIQDFFPTKRLTRKFDCILSHAVLEHVEKPDEFVSEIYDTLAGGGCTFIAVPDSEKKMLVGDPSVLTHQHVNYFTKYSLQILLQRIGFSRIKVWSSDKRSILYGWGVKAADGRRIPNETATGDHDGEIFSAFDRNVKKNISSIQKLLTEREKRGRTVGLYAPSIVLDGLLSFSKEPRLFDTDEMKHGRFMAGFKNRIESPLNLVDHPVDVLFIAPVDYDTEIRSYLKSILPHTEKTEIISLKKIYEENSGVRYAVGSVA